MTQLQSQTAITLGATASAIEAAATNDPAAPVMFRGVAYRGDAIATGGFEGGVVIDLVGLTIPPAVPVVLDHQLTVDTRLGTATAQVQQNELVVEGSVVPGSPGADRFIALLRAGGCSLSVNVGVQAVEVAAANGETVVNGRAVQGGMEIARKGVLREISAVGVGADHGAHAIAASLEAGTMTQTTDTVVLAERERAMAERERITEINAIFDGIEHSDAVKANLINTGATLDVARARALDLLRFNRSGVTSVRTVQASGGSDSGDPKTILGAAVMRLTGDHALGEKEFGERAMQAADDLRVDSLLDLCHCSLQLSHQDIPRSRDKVVQASFSTTSLPEILGDSLGKRAAAALVAAEEPWRDIANDVDLNSFREHKFVRLNGQLQLEEVGRGGELTHGTLGEEFSVLRASTYGRTLVLTRQDIIDDNLGMFQQIPQIMGAEAARSVGDMFYEVLQAGDEENGGTFFTDERGNRLSGSGTYLGSPALTVAVASMRKQRDASGRALNIPPKALLVSPDLESVARSLLNSTELGTTDGEPRGNPLKGIAELYVDARLGPNEWYLFGPKQNAAIQIGFVNGRRTPIIENQPVDFSQLGTGWRIYWDYGVGLHEHRSAVYATGEA